MVDLLNSGTWPILSVIVAIIALVATITIYLLNKKKKAIGYEIVQNLQLISIKGDVRERVELFFDKKKISDVSLVLFRIFNLGDIPIVQTDVLKPITVHFGEGAKILEATIESISPSNLDVHFSIKENSLEISTPLLNSKESMTFKMLISQYSYIKIDARIVGITEFKDVTYKRETYENIRESILMTSSINPLAQIHLRIFDLLTNRRKEKE
jgi:hypothetical protein